MAFDGTGGFGRIRPDEKDYFQFDFSDRLGEATILSVEFTLAVDAGSAVDDPDPASKILSTPTISGGVVSLLLGGMVDGCLYSLTADAPLSDFRTVAASGTILCTLEAPTTLDPGQFRLDFPEFSSTADYADSLIQRYLDVAYVEIGATIWGALQDYGVALYVAHNLVLSRQAMRAAERGGVPGSRMGVLSSESVGGAAVSYNSAGITLDNAGAWNATAYGIRFAQMRRELGRGGLQV